MENNVELKSEEAIRKMLYPDLVEYASEIGLAYEYQKKDELVEEILMKQHGRNVRIAPELRDTVLDGDRVAYPKFIKSANQELGVSDHVMPDTPSVIDSVRGNSALLVRIREFVKSGNGYLRVVKIFGANCELVPMGMQEDESEKLILPLKVLVKVNVPEDMKKSKSGVVIEDDEKPIEGIGRRALDMDIEDAIDAFNKKNGNRMEFVELYSYMKGKRKLWRVKVRYKGVDVEVAHRKFLEALGNGTIIAMINYDMNRDKSVRNRYVGKIDLQLEDRHYAILNSHHSKSEKIRKLYRSGLPMSQISTLLDINYSFTYCVVEKYRKLLNEE